MWSKTQLFLNQKLLESSQMIRRMVKTVSLKSRKITQNSCAACGAGKFSRVGVEGAAARNPNMT